MNFSLSLSCSTKVLALASQNTVLLLSLVVVVKSMMLCMCRYLTANGLCASDEARQPFPPCEFIRRGREFCDCSVYREYMIELYLNSEYVYDAETDTFLMHVSRDLNDWEREYYAEPPF